MNEWWGYFFISLTDKIIHYFLNSSCLSILWAFTFVVPLREFFTLIPNLNTSMKILLLQYSVQILSLHEMFPSSAYIISVSLICILTCLNLKKYILIYDWLLCTDCNWIDFALFVSFPSYIFLFVQYFCNLTLFIYFILYLIS